MNLYEVALDMQGTDPHRDDADVILHVELSLPLERVQVPQVRLVG